MYSGETVRTLVDGAAAIVIAGIGAVATVYAAGAKRRANRAVENTMSVSNGAIPAMTRAVARIEGAVSEVSSDVRALSGRVDMVQGSVNDVRQIQAEHLRDHVEMAEARAQACQAERG
jgi:hypothetical protein